MQNPTRGNSLPLRNREISRAATVHRSEIAEFHAREVSTAQKLQNSTRGKCPPLGKCRILRAGVIHRSEIAEFHAWEPSTAQESHFLTRGEDLSSSEYLFLTFSKKNKINKRKSSFYANYIYREKIYEIRKG